MEEYTIYCTVENVRKILSIDESLLNQRIDAFASVDAWEHPEKYYESDNENIYVIPTAEQVIGWLEEYYRITFEISEVTSGFRYGLWYWNEKIKYPNKFDFLSEGIRFSSRKDATLAAINIALDFVIKNKK